MFQMAACIKRSIKTSVLLSEIDENILASLGIMGLTIYLIFVLQMSRSSGGRDSSVPNAATTPPAMTAAMTPNYIIPFALLCVFVPNFSIMESSFLFGLAVKKRCWPHRRRARG
jgi:hypothetical protein